MGLLRGEREGITGQLLGRVEPGRCLIARAKSTITSKEVSVQGVHFTYICIPPRQIRHQSRGASPQVSLSWPTGLFPPLDYAVSNSRFHAKGLPLCPLFHPCGWSSFSCFFFSFFFLVPGEICKGWVLGLARRQVYYALRECRESCVCVCVHGGFVIMWIYSLRLICNLVKIVVSVNWSLCTWNVRE